MVPAWPRTHRGFWALSFVLVGVAASTGSLALAQTVPPPEEPPTFQLPEVIVPGKRPQPQAATPASVSVLTRADLDRLGVLTVGEALQFLPEVQIRFQGGLGALALPSIRGSSTKQVQVLIDGIPVNSAIQGLFDLSTISTASVDRIEVLRGPFSALYGGSALGGVINVITSDVPGDRLAVRGGGLGTVGASVWWSTADRRVTFAADQFASDGARPNSDVTSATIVAKAKWEAPPGDTLTLSVNQFRSTLGVPGSTACPSPLARQTETRTMLATEWHRAADGGEWRAQAYGWSDDLRYIETTPPPCFDPSSRTVTQVYGAMVQRVVRVTPDYVWVAGLEGQSQALSDTSLGNQQAAVGGVYVQNEQRISARSLLSAGMRYDVHSVYGGQVNPRIGVVSLVRDDLTLRVAFGRTFRAPTLSELYLGTASNASLRPESAWSVDIGLTWHDWQGAEVRTTIFGTAATDLISFVFNPTTGQYQLQNIGRTTVTGGSIEWAWPSSGGIGVNLNATVTRATDDSSGTQLLRVPWVTASATLQFPVPDGTVSLLTSYVGSRLDVDPVTFATIQMPGYVLLGLRITQGTRETGQWQLGVDNLGALPYQPIAGYPAPGLTAFVSFARSF